MKKLQITALALFVLILLIPGVVPAHAAVNVIYIFDFGANCRDFSIDVRLRGMTDDGNGLDRFRYVIIDGSGAVLYQEDASRPVGQWGFAEGIDLPYQHKPTTNPVIFTVQDVDSTGKVISELQRVRHDVACLPRSGLAGVKSGFFPRYTVLMSTTKVTAIYDAPNGTVIDRTIPGGLHAVYRSADNQWIATYNDFLDFELSWVPASDTSSPDMLPIRPTRIERSAILGQPTGVVMQADARVHAQPNLNATTLGFVDPWDPPYYLEVLARTADSHWIEVKYNAAPAWVDVGDLSSYDLLTGDLLNIPVVAYPGK